MSIKLLLASEYAMVREGFRLLLRPAAEIEFVGEVERLPDASKKYCELKPDVALLDVAANNGSVGLKAVRNLVQSSPKACSLVVTNNHEVSYARSILAAGARGLVLKHSPSSDLITAVRTTAAGRKFIDSRLRHALTMEPEVKTIPKQPRLTEREIQILRELANGYTNSQTASHLHLTLRTVETYRARICRKLHIRDRAGLVQYAIAEGLLS